LKILIALLGLLLLLGLLFAIVATLSAAPAKALTSHLPADFNVYSAQDVTEKVNGIYYPLPVDRQHGLATSSYIFSIARSGTRCNFSVFGFPTLENYNAFIVGNFWEMDLESDELRKGVFSIRNVQIYASCNRDEQSHEIITPVGLALSAFDLSRG